MLIQLRYWNILFILFIYSTSYSTIDLLFSTSRHFPFFHFLSPKRPLFFLHFFLYPFSPTHPIIFSLISSLPNPPSVFLFLLCLFVYIIWVLRWLSSFNAFFCVIYFYVPLSFPAFSQCLFYLSLRVSREITTPLWKWIIVWTT